MCGGGRVPKWGTLTSTGDRAPGAGRRTMGNSSTASMRGHATADPDRSASGGPAPRGSRETRRGARGGGTSNRTRAGESTNVCGCVTVAWRRPREGGGQAGQPSSRGEEIMLPTHGRYDYSNITKRPDYT